MLTVCLHGYVLCHIPMSGNSCTSATALWPTILCALCDSHPASASAPSSESAMAGSLIEVPHLAQCHNAGGSGANVRGPDPKDASVHR
ncbi:hypothetical protein MRX96_023997 [Rhipicephalus microplus]